jgi:hypothetical protein
MSLWQVRFDKDHVYMGERRRRKLSSDGCNEPMATSRGSAYWCPKRGWFSSRPCPFLNKRECDTYKRLCGAL